MRIRCNLGWPDSMKPPKPRRLFPAEQEVKHASQRQELHDRLAEHLKDRLAEHLKARGTAHSCQKTEEAEHDQPTTGTMGDCHYHLLGQGGK